MNKKYLGKTFFCITASKMTDNNRVFVYLDSDKKLDPKITSIERTATRYIKAMYPKVKEIIKHGYRETIKYSSFDKSVVEYEIIT